MCSFGCVDQASQPASQLIADPPWLLGGSQTLELRDDGRFGFLLPDDQIIPNAEEMVPAMLEYGLAVLEAFEGARARREDAAAPNGTRAR